MAMIIEGGDFSGYYSNIPIQMIQNYVRKKFSYSGCGTSYGRNSANINFNFDKITKFSFNKNFSFNPFNWNKEPLFGYFEESINAKKLLKEIQDLLISKGYKDIQSKIEGGNFCFKILSEKEKRLEEIKNNVNNF